MVSADDLDTAALGRELSAAMRGEVRLGPGARALYATDASNYRAVPLGVVYPRDAEDVLAALAVCRRFDLPIVARGGGTALAGQSANHALVIDMSRHMDQLLALDPEACTARVQPGLVLDALRTAAKLHGLTFAPDPATHAWCTLGGMIGNNSCGVHSVMGGRTADNVLALEVVTYEGERMTFERYDDASVERLVATGDARAPFITGLRALRDRHAAAIRARFPPIPRRVSGYNLPSLLPEQGFDVAKALVGSECTCVLVLAATVRLVPSPPERALVVIGYPDVYAAADDVPAIMASGPLACEGIDDFLVADMKKKEVHVADLELLPEGKGWLVVEVGGDTLDEVAERARALKGAVEARASQAHAQVVDAPDRQQRIWEVREAGLAATARVPGSADTWPGWEDSAVPPERLGEYLRKLRALFAAHGYAASLYGHFGQGCVHCRIDFDLASADGRSRYRAFVEAAADLVVSLGGSLSGEHGDGQSRGELLVRMFGPELIEAFAAMKRLFDPRGRMNPGKVVAPRPLDADLRVADIPARAVSTTFKFVDDDGSFARATMRCVGVGKCRRESGGTMCPSWRATHDEQHTTRGRAHLLFEMLRRDSPLDAGWDSDEVRGSLDLCLACKGCKRDCPMGVDMATYKAEFLSHYHEERLRPRAALSMGRLHQHARLALRVPRLANLMTQTPGVRRVAKWIAGVHPQRAIPRFTTDSLRAWLGRRGDVMAAGPGGPGGGDEVLLWIDTWTNAFHPEIGRAAVSVLEAAGAKVRAIDRWLCCGRPLYDFGLLAAAKRRLEACMEATAPWVEAGVPLVVLEPSCASVFRDELVALFPDDPRARALCRATRTLGEYLQGRELDVRLHGQWLMHGHCHARAVLGFDADAALMRRLGAEVEVIDGGCCGMAGSFGFERDKFEVSRRIAEQGVLARLGARPGVPVVADGFSCHLQLDQLGDRAPRHLAQVLAEAVKTTVPAAPPPSAPSKVRRALPTAMVLLALACVWWILSLVTGAT